MNSLGLKTILIFGSLLLVIVPVHAAYAFTFKITIWAVDASSDMGKMVVKVTVKEKEHSFSTDKGRTKSKVVDIGKTALKEDESDFKVASFDFKQVDKGDKYIACIAGACHDSETIGKSKITEKISVSKYRDE